MKKIIIWCLCLFWLFLSSVVWAQKIEIFPLKKEKVENRDCYFSFFDKLREQLRKKIVFFSLSENHKIHIVERKWLFFDGRERKEVWVIVVYLDLGPEPFDWEEISKLESGEAQEQKAVEFSEKILKQFKTSELLKRGTDL